VTCGACCCNNDGNRAAGFFDYVEVHPGDALRKRSDLLSKLAIRNADRQVHLRLTEDGRCVALDGTLGVSVHCSIYALRPTVCRRVQPHSEECLSARRERGIDATAG